MTMLSAFRSILAATDLGSGSDAIVSSAARLAAHTGAELHLLHSLDLPWIPSEDVVRRTGLRAQIAAAEDRLRAQVERTMPEGVRPASQCVLVDAAHRAVLERALEVSADLIAIGPHRGRATAAHFLGTTADRVVRTAGSPCLLLRDSLALPLRRIGVPIDFSDDARNALQVALRWGVTLRSEAGPEVWGMHVGLPLEQVIDPRREETLLRPELKRQVAIARAAIPGSEELDVRVEVLWAQDAGAATVAWAGERNVDLLCMGTHGKGGLARALIGSVTFGVALRAPCAVLLVPPQGAGTGVRAA